MRRPTTGSSSGSRHAWNIVGLLPVRAERRRSGCRWQSSFGVFAADFHADAVSLTSRAAGRSRSGDDRRRRRVGRADGRDRPPARRASGERLALIPAHLHPVVYLVLSWIDHHPGGSQRQEPTQEDTRDTKKSCRSKLCPGALCVQSAQRATGSVKQNLLPRVFRRGSRPRSAHDGRPRSTSRWGAPESRGPVRSPPPMPAESFEDRVPGRFGYSGPGVGD